MFNSNLILATFSPSNLFNGGEQGVWFDPSDFSTMFQDDAGSTPVTAVGDPVGLIRDKSGRGNHASQATSTKRPVLRQDSSGYYYLEFDGTDDSLATASINPGSVNKSQAFIGLRKVSQVNAGVVYETSAIYTGSNGVIAMFAPGSAGASHYQGLSKGTAAVIATVTGFTAPVTTVLSVASNISGPSVTTRANGGATTSTATGSQGTGNYLSHILYIGQRAGSTVPFNGRIYGMIIRFSASNLDATTIDAAETWMNGKTGAY